jgi:hypothetical protein
MTTFESGELKVEVVVTRDALKLSWLGRSVERDPAKNLSPFFGTLEAHIRQNRSVELDFRDLEFMNSSTVKPILVFCQKASTKARAVSVRYNSTKTWQRLSFGLLKAMSATWNNVTVEG